jgi:hypothetical protein
MRAHRKKTEIAVEDLKKYGKVTELTFTQT